jgi:hypothetical protein
MLDARLTELHKKLCEIILNQYKDSDGEPSLRAAHPYLGDVQVNLGMCKYFLPENNKNSYELLLKHAKNLIDAIGKINAAPISYIPSLKSGECACPFKGQEWYQNSCKPIIMEALEIAKDLVNKQKLLAEINTARSNKATI